MDINTSQEFVGMMNGDIGEFSAEELSFILCHLDELEINTLSVQMSVGCKYYCKVDKPTIDKYKNESRKI